MAIAVGRGFAIELMEVSMAAVRGLPEAKNSGRTLEQTPFYSEGLSKNSPQAEQR